VSAELRDVSFPAAVRGYDRRAVDGYVQRVNRLIAELEVSSSPESAVRHALDRVGEQTSGILHRARETAEEITVTARAEAEETTARSRAEASEIVAASKADADEIVARANAEAGERRERANETVARSEARAKDIVARAEKQAAERLERGKAEFESLQRGAEERMAALRADTDAIEAERRRLVEEVRGLAARLEELVKGEPEPEAEPGEVATTAVPEGEA
jgi:DivIVA domain-containing protein